VLAKVLQNAAFYPIVRVRDRLFEDRSHTSHATSSDLTTVPVDWQIAGFEGDLQS